MPSFKNDRIVIIDYGAGNLKNLKNAFDFLNVNTEIASDPSIVSQATKMLLPGVGAFGFAMKNLRLKKLDEVIIKNVQNGIPLFGICLGMQLIFTESQEAERHVGLDLIPGKVVRFEISLKVPHIGWNTLIKRNDSPLISDLKDDSYAYFVHSYHCVPDDPKNIITETEYELKFCSMAQRDHIFGAQFHPEKSQEVGLKILQNFVEI
ncbi:imidazole glycerol phosphate synthase subunit HisH [candidate division KSB1 bacterium]|nr:imidazole glycerol phosphate synthase subunit HisH [candidate division KSB1 bacterium]